MNKMTDIALGELYNTWYGEYWSLVSCECSGELVSTEKFGLFLPKYVMLVCPYHSYWTVKR